MILVKKFGANRLFFCKQKSELAICSVKTNNLLIRSFIMSNLTESLFWHERPERLTYNHSFVLSNLSKWLTVTHLIWAIWANERINEWANSQPWCQRSFFSSGTQYPQSRWLHGHIDNDYVAMEIDNKFVTFMEQLREKKYWGVFTCPIAIFE